MLMNFKKINHDILLLDICCNFINNESILEKWHYINNIYNDLQKNREIYQKDNTNKVAKNYLDNDNFTLQHIIPEIKEDIYQYISPTMFLYIDNLKNNELSIVSTRLKEDLKQGSNLNEVIKQQLEIAKSMLMELFKKLHQNVVFLVEEKELKSLPKSLVIGEFPKYELNTTNFKNIYNMMNSVIKKINKTDEYFNELVVLKKVYIEIIAGENICYKK